MEPLLGVKIGCLFALLVLTLVCGLIPICFKWFQIDAATGTALPPWAQNLHLTVALSPVLTPCSEALTAPELGISGATCLLFCHLSYLIAHWIVTPPLFRSSPPGPQPPGLRLCWCFPGSGAHAHDR